jgi:hypothetical protein
MKTKISPMNKTYPYALALLFVLTPLSAFATGETGTAEGNGGDTREMRQAELSRAQIEELLRNNGEQLKLQFLLPIVNNLPSRLIEDEWARQSYERMKDNSLKNDILFTVYDITSPDCQNLGRAARTDSRLRSRICLDINYIARDGNSRASLAGLLIHEHAHHFGIDDDGQYRLANAIKYAVIQGRHLLPRFQVFGDLSTGAPIYHNGRSLDAGDSLATDWQGNLTGDQKQRLREKASIFCRSMGYYRASISHVTWFTLVGDGTAIYLLDGQANLIPSRLEPGTTRYLFDEITCARDRP